MSPWNVLSIIVNLRVPCIQATRFFYFFIFILYKFYVQLLKNKNKKWNFFLAIWLSFWFFIIYKKKILFDHINVAKFFRVWALRCVCVYVSKHFYKSHLEMWPNNPNHIVFRWSFMNYACKNQPKTLLHEDLCLL